jgi:hypothetical protein
MKYASAIVVLLTLAVSSASVFHTGQRVQAFVFVALTFAVVRRRSDNAPAAAARAGKAPAVSAAASGARKAMGVAAAEPAALPPGPAIVPLPSTVALLALPCVLLSEKIGLHTVALGHSALAMYAAVLWAWVGTMPPSRDRSVYLLSSGALCAVLVGVVTENPAIGGALALFLAVAHETDRGLARAGVPASEAHVVAALCGFAASDVAGNAQLMHESFSTVTTTSVEHVAGRSALVAAWLLCAALARVREAGAVPAAAAGRTAVFAGCCAAALTCAFAVMALQLSHAGGLAVLSELFAPTATTPPVPRVVTVAALAVVLPVALWASFRAGATMQRIAARKLFHVTAVVAFTVPSAVDPIFMGFMWAVAIAAAAVIEAGRLFGVAGSGRLTASLAAVTDARDAGVVRTHLYLMAACALPLFLQYRAAYHLAVPVAYATTTALALAPGLGALGVLDAAAALVGSSRAAPTALKFLAQSDGFVARFGGGFSLGDNPALRHKSLQGLAAGVLCFALYVAAAVVGTGFVMGAGRVPREVLMAAWWLRLGAVALVAGLFEATSDGVDNLELPLVTAALCRVLLR